MPNYRDSFLTRLLAGILFLLVLCYALFEARWMIIGPVISVTSDTSATSSMVLVLTGTALHSSTFSINGAPITISQEGQFDETYALSPGVNYFFLDARDRYGHSRHLAITVVSTATSGPNTFSSTSSSTALKTLSTTTSTTSTKPTRNNQKLATTSMATTSVVQ